MEGGELGQVTSSDSLSHTYVLNVFSVLPFWLKGESERASANFSHPPFAFPDMGNEGSPQEIFERDP